jgi:hypothetical protein
MSDIFLINFISWSFITLCFNLTHFLSKQWGKDHMTSLDTVFSHVIQKRFSQVNEDVATDALAYILQSSEKARQGFMKLLRGLETSMPNLQFRTQQSEGNIRPDMGGFDGTQARLFIENKFWAGLTDNQPVSYLRQLAKFTQPTILLIIVPVARVQTIWRELINRLEESNISSSERDAPAGLAFSSKTELGPILALTSWSKILSVMELEAEDDRKAMNDIYQLRALCDAADSEAFIPLSAEDISDQRIPSYILQLNTIVQDSVQLATVRGFIDFNGLRPQASWERIGRYIRFVGAGKVGCWIGIHFGLWKKHGYSPLWLVFSSDDFSRAPEVKEHVEPWAAMHDIPAIWENGYFCMGLKLLTAEDKDLVVKMIVERLSEVENILTGIKPPISNTQPTG